MELIFIGRIRLALENNLIKENMKETKPNKKLELEAEMGRLFLQIEQMKAQQAQIAQRINEILEELKKVE